MALNYSRQLNGLQFVPQNTIPPTEPGEVRYNSSTNKLELFDGSVNPIVSETGTATLTNKTITGNAAANLVNAAGVLVINTTGTITVPDATDTLVGRDTVDTLINKSIDASTNTITGLTTANFAPVADQTIISNISGAPAAPTANTLTAIFDDILSSVQGDIIYRNAASWVTLPPGTSGQVLSTGGPAANPSWVNQSGGGAGTVTNVATGTGLTGGPITTTGTISLATIANNTILANTSGGVAAPVATTVSTLLDSLTTTQGSIIYRNATNWVSLPPGTSGQFLKTQGAAANPLWATATGSSINPTVQTFISTGAGTYTTPASVQYIRVVMVGGGGGGGGASLNGGAPGSGGAGVASTFKLPAGPALLVANGGAGGPGARAGGIGTGGTASLGTGPVGIAMQGGTGSIGIGAPSFFGGGGGVWPWASGNGTAAAVNSGAGGGGGVIPGTGASGTGGFNTDAGSGGGAGGYVDAIITTPAASYSYIVGARGGFGGAGTGTGAGTGGVGGDGMIVVYEYY